MTRTNALTVLCMMIRAFAALAAVRLLMAIPVVLGAGVGFDGLSVGARLASMLVPLAVIAFMWLFPDWLAKAALMRRSGEVFETDVDARALLTIGLAVVAIVTLVDGIVESISLLFTHLAIAGAEDGLREYPEGFGVSVWTRAVELVTGVALLLGARGLSALAFRIRYGDLQPGAVGDTAPKSDES